VYISELNRGIVLWKIKWLSLNWQTNIMAWILPPWTVLLSFKPLQASPTQPYVEGIINLRGEILPVIDMRKRLAMPQREETGDTRVMVVEIGGDTVGMIVDAVTEVLRVSIEDIEPPSPMVTKIDAGYITGIAKVTDRLIILLDLTRALSNQEQNELKTTGANAAVSGQPPARRPTQSPAGVHPGFI
jgi:purine-binding chemotaxis protein CheW